MTEPARTHHERVIDHLKRATKALEQHRQETIAATQAHLDARATPPNDDDTESEA